jgi:soluble lytic murein transglycosylase-like protein
MKRRIMLLAAIVLSVSATGLWADELDARLAKLEAAAAQGDPMARTELAVRYEHAEGVAKDFQKANRLYCLAARQGYADAQFKLGWVYANGRGVQRDDGVAAALFVMAAKQGHEHAAKLLLYVVQKPETQLPSCMFPDPVVATEDESGEPPRDQTEIEQLVHRLAPQYAVDPQFALAVIRVESAFNPAAQSPKNAQGLMQLIPETAARFGVKQVLNPAENIKGGLAYLRWLLAFFEGDVHLVAAAYNAGERAVEKYHGIPPYPETRNYVRKIASLYKKTSHPYEVGIVEPSPILLQLKRTQG